MKNLKPYLFVILALVTFPMSSCKKNKLASCSATISYANDIAPMMSQNCTGCHNASNASGGYNLTTYSNVSSSADIILKSMRHSSGVDNMPKGSSKMATDVVDKFDCWNQQGKANN